MRILLVAALATTLAGCLPAKDTDWPTTTGINLNCPEAMKPPPRLIVKDLYNIDDDQRPEAFVAMRCASSEFGQVEAYRGDSDPTHPERRDVLVHRDEGWILHECFVFGSKRVTVQGFVGGALKERVVSWSKDKINKVDRAPQEDCRTSKT